MSRRVALVSIALALALAGPPTALAQAPSGAAPASSAAPTTAVPTSSAAPATAVPASTAAPASGGGDSTAALVLLAVVGIVLLAAAVAWGAARWWAWEPRWVLRARHAGAEAGWRASNTWADFRDWLRFGR